MDSQQQLRSTKRFRLLLQQLIAEDPEASQQKLAEDLGISQGHLSKLAHGKRNAGIDLIELSIRKLKISPLFFFGNADKDPHYRDYKGIRKLAPTMGHPALYRFLKLAEDGGIPITSREKSLLTEQEWDGDPTTESYMLLLQAFRSVKVPEDTLVRLRKDTTAKKQRQGSDAS